MKGKAETVIKKCPECSALEPELPTGRILMTFYCDGCSKNWYAKRVPHDIIWKHTKY